MKKTYTVAARRMARKLNQAMDRGLGGNGKLVFCQDGDGGAWYSDLCYGLGDDVIVIPVPWERITAGEVQEMLDALDDF